jgi:hypothetical protein
MVARHYRGGIDVFTRVLLASLKAVAAGLGVFISAGVLSGNWATDAHIAESLITAAVTWLTPNVGYYSHRRL